MRTNSFIFFFVMILLGESLQASCYLDTSIRHSEGKGIGFNNGYTTLDIFGMSANNDAYSFVNFRGHGLNNKKLAANLGIGLRHLADSTWIFGANLYYDCRQGIHKNFDQVGYLYQQAGIGIEMLGPTFDIRANMYQPLGKQQRIVSQIFFMNNNGITPTLLFKEEESMKGFDAEIGGCIGSGNFNGETLSWSTYAAAGAYYLNAKNHKNRLGGKCRFKLSFANYYTLELRGIYDQVQHGSGQIIIGINFPLYPNLLSSNSKYRGCNNSSPDALIEQILWERITKPIERAEILPLRTFLLDTL